MSRGVDVVLLCEDKQHSAFARRFLEKRGWSRHRIRVELSPAGRGSGEQFVREHFPRELKKLRTRSASTMLVAVIDGDEHGPEARRKAIAEACGERGIEPPRDGEAAAIFVPTWRIETWLAYLDGQDVDENERYYPKLKKEKKCRRHVDELLRMCERGALREPAPPSLEDACREFNTRLLHKAGK